MTCQGNCSRELTQCDPISPGPVQDGEMIARGAFDPTHGEAKKGNIRPSIVPKKDLFADKLSVWRLGDVPQIPVKELVERLKTESGARTLYAIVSVQAGDIRQIKVEVDKARALCVLDECDTDHDGGKHPAHAHVALCSSVRASLDPGEVGLSSPVFIQICRDLANLIKNSNKHTVS